MSEADTDDENKNVEDDSKDPKEVSGVAPTLDQVHQLTQRQLEEEAENEADDNDSSEEDEEEVDDEQEGDEAGGGSGDDDEAGDDEGKEPVVPEPKPVAPQDDSNAKSAPELDSDTSKPGKDKVAIKDAEGKTHYFNNRSEVPMDFEPASYKELMDASATFTRKEIKDEETTAKNEADAADAAEKEETKKRTEAMQVEWERDFADLTSSGLIPKDATKNEAAKQEVYDYIAAELAKNNVITNVKQAYKSMMYDKQQAEREDEQKKTNEAKKKRGGVVQPGGNGAGGSGTAVRGGGKVFEAPPPGVGLDAVHNRAVEQLG